MRPFILAIFWLVSWLVEQPREFNGISWSTEQPMLDNVTLISYNNFRLHGWWPSNQNCSGKQFNLNELNPILNNMLQYWSYSTNFTINEQFWQHEWEKHGTCSNLSQLDYFSLALKHYFWFNPLLCLTRAGITPSKNYWRLKLVKSVLFRCFPISFSLICSETGNYLNEIYFHTNESNNCPNKIKWKPYEHFE